MTTLDYTQKLILLNFCVCAIGAAISVCRMGVMRKSTAKLQVRAIYYFYFMTFITSMLSWLWGQPPGLVQISMGLLILGVLIVGFGAWRHGPPAHTYKSVSAFLSDVHAAATGQHQTYTGIERRQ